eukprot:CAMPEP_0119339312 /NCGR_PEP_ID=MMETSP1333-20130426/98007_1 /TAXON_ID=418940 /ORGANISM="Scyphosphaera apsteinii, Strain RCC1455" /LENGTH=100 /DNA_ID=CAMNT_0007350807 /DNA_START=107 /DNA_END=406 /DNA_ORIENTATION=-
MPSVRSTATSISPARSDFVMAPVPPGNEDHSIFKPCFAKAPVASAVCHGVLKCSGTPPTRNLVATHRTLFLWGENLVCIAFPLLRNASRPMDNPRYVACD